MVYTLSCGFIAIYITRIGSASFDFPLEALARNRLRVN
jgi:hypothetical protein